MQPLMKPPEYVSTLADGTVKQLNPFTGTEVWTVAGRGNRPLGIQRRDPQPLDPAQAGAHCVFCERRYRDTPPEKARVVRGADGTWQTQRLTMAEDLNATVAEFRRIPNLFEILSYNYWHANYGYTLNDQLRAHAGAYLAQAAGRAHLDQVLRGKLKAMGVTDPNPTEADLLEAAHGFFASGHDVIVARRHFVDGATDDAALASAGSLSLEEHRQFLGLTVEAAQDLFAQNRYARYVAVFQNWLRPAGASLDHLHKQLVAIDERGVQHGLALERLRANPDMYNEDAANYAAFKNLVIAENEFALAFAGYGHRYPTIEIYSKSEAPDPWDHRPAELTDMSNMIHAMHAATGVDVPCNEEWHYRPIDSEAPMPWRVILKWRISTLAGFEGATKIYLNTIDPYSLRDRVVPVLYQLRSAGAIAQDIKIATECDCRPNPLRYTVNRKGE
ncbi:MAG: DUF4921 family protein [Bifidobacteriaceae bacterium]|jgi:galactose-1-phosphate uridylyltransferase|nr:DUF4921 family protein [Bifidobacteriaceae bacterium]